MPYDQMKTWFPNTVPDYDRELFGPYLEAMAETPLYGQVSNASVYRLLWLRMRDRDGFGPAICVRMEQTGEKASAQLVVKETKENRDRRPGELLLSQERTLTIEQFCALQSLLARVDFWNIPTTEQGPIGGELWLIEALHQGRYHAVDRCCLEVAIGAILDESMLSKLPKTAIPVVENLQPIAAIAVFMLQEAGIVNAEQP